MKILDKLKAEAAKVGATVDHDPETGAIYVDAPARKLWKCDFVHALCGQACNRGGQTWYADEVRELLRRMSYGLDDCTEPDCDICEV
jgi:hypothetical protein